MKLKMRKLQKTPCFWPAVAIGSLLLQWFGRGTFLMWAIIPILAYAVWRSIKLIREQLPERFTQRITRGRKHAEKLGAAAIPEAPPPPPDPPRRRRNDNPGEIHSLVEQMLLDGRYGLLLRPQIAPDLTREMFQRAYHSLEDEMALVPTGEVGIELQDFSAPKPEGSFHEAPEAVVRVNSLFMDRYPVTNEQFQAFVDAGGYEQSSLWHPEILPAVLDFVDRSGNPGPRFWRNGRYEPGKAKHPVVGVSWYEACAIRTLGGQTPCDRRRMGEGRRLAGGAWHLDAAAASLPVGPGDGSRTRQPLDLLDRSYRLGRGFPRWRQRRRRVPDDRQRVGMDTWRLRRRLRRFHARRSGALRPQEIRGGAFDTYFDTQATCQFASGEHPLAQNTISVSAASWELATSRSIPRRKTLCPPVPMKSNWPTCEVTA